MIKKIKINDLVFPVDYTLNSADLDTKYPDEADTTTIGVYDADEQKIFIAKDIGYKRKLRVLLHECIEAINDCAELCLQDNHAKIVGLENATLSFILNNREFIQLLWKEADKEEP